MPVVQMYPRWSGAWTPGREFARRNELRAGRVDPHANVDEVAGGLYDGISDRELDLASYAELNPLAVVNGTRASAAAVERVKVARVNYAKRAEKRARDVADARSFYWGRGSEAANLQIAILDDAPEPDRKRAAEETLLKYYADDKVFDDQERQVERVARERTDAKRAAPGAGEDAAYREGERLWTSMAELMVHGDSGHNRIDSADAQILADMALLRGNLAYSRLARASAGGAAAAEVETLSKIAREAKRDFVRISRMVDTAEDRERAERSDARAAAPRGAAAAAPAAPRGAAAAAAPADAYPRWRAPLGAGAVKPSAAKAPPKK